MKSLNGQKTGNDFAVITDPGSSLEQVAKTHQFRRCFINDPNIGGRFSALSLFGLVPAALCGINLKNLLKSAMDADWSLAAETGAIMGLLALKGCDKMTLVLSRELASFGDWAEQLVAESTGKNGRGILPVLGEPVLSPGQTSTDRFFVHIKLASDRSMDKPLSRLADAAFPVLTLTLDDPYQLGEQFLIWELATAVSGYLLGINPFDQPNVESAKAAARAMMAEYLKKGNLPSGEVSPWNGASLKRFLKSAGTGDYIALQAYIPMTPETEFRINHLQAALKKYTGLAVTRGFGPRFLHSTGQLHKGDRGNGLFIQITCDALKDAAIPNEPGEQASAMSFHILKTAQAMGDFQALKNQGRRVIHFHAQGDLITALEAMRHWIG
jgi:transaldolase/glucose-6-phosphate isomerase